MYRRSDPRFRRTLNEISQTIESANESAQANIFTFSHRYLSPCFSSLGQCFQSCSCPCPCSCSCIPLRDERTRRSRARSRGRAELSFDFYDDWEDEDETAGLLAWDNDDLDRLLPGSGGYGATTAQPPRQRAMSYGARRDKHNRRKSQSRNDPDSDATLIPTTSYFGFLGRFSAKLAGPKALRYKPSAADLQEHPGASHPVPETEHDQYSTRTRNRSNTAGSAATTDSFSSRGDIFPSEDEDDAVPLDDGFAMVLERRTTGSGLDDTSSGKVRSGKRPSTGSRLSTRTMSSRSTRSSKRYSRAASISPSRDGHGRDDPKIVPSMTELKQEEDRMREEEEADIARRREAANRLASRRGLSLNEATSSPSIEGKPLPSPSSTNDEGRAPYDEPKEMPSLQDETTPFPTFDPATPEEQDSGFVPAQLPRFSAS